MFAEERQAKIILFLEKEKSITVTDLSHRFSVSVDTIRRDLKQLEERDLIIKTHGGVMMKDHNLKSTKVTFRQDILTKEKKVIALKALDYIKDGDIIFLDGSSTTLQVIPYLTMKDLTIVTNSIYTAHEVLENSIECTLHVIGGSILQNIGSAINASSHQYLTEFKFKKAFISCCSVDFEEGYFDINSEEAIMKRLIIERSEHIYWLLDHTKFNQSGYVKIIDISGEIISDDLLEETLKSDFKRRYQMTIK